MKTRWHDSEEEVAELNAKGSMVFAPQFTRPRSGPPEPPHEETADEELLAAGSSLVDAYLALLALAQQRSEAGDVAARLFVWLPFTMGYPDRKEAASWLGSVAAERKLFGYSADAKRAQRILAQGAEAEIAARPYPDLKQHIWDDLAERGRTASARRR